MPKTAAQPEIPAIERIARLLALLVIKDVDDKTKQALTLDGAGFNSNEIAEMLGVGPNYLNVIKHRRKTTRRKAKR